jgi:nitrilase
MIINPWGQPMAELKTGAGVIAEELDLEYLRNLRRSFPALDHCRISCI